MAATSMTNELKHSIDGSANIYWTVNEWMNEWGKNSTTKNQDVALFYWAIGLFSLPSVCYARQVNQIIFFFIAVSSALSYLYRTSDSSTVQNRVQQMRMKHTENNSNNENPIKRKWILMQSNWFIYEYGCHNKYLVFFSRFVSVYYLNLFKDQAVK